MQNVVSAGKETPETVGTPLRVTAQGGWKNWQRELSLDNSAVRMLLGFLLIGLVGCVNVATGAGLNLDVFYLLGCGFVGWVGGARAAMGATAEACLILLLNIDQHSASGLASWVAFWNFGMRSLTFLAVGWLASEIGVGSRGLERTVQERTARLQQEIEEHKATLGRLRDTLQLFRHLTENITAVFWVTDPARSKVNYISQAYERIWGRKRESVYSSPETGAYPERTILLFRERC